jgi:hypothetical protein
MTTFDGAKTFFASANSVSTSEHYTINQVGHLRSQLVQGTVLLHRTFLRVQRVHASRVLGAVMLDVDGED